MKSAFYHQHHLGPLGCVIVMDHDDGTVSLARKADEAAFVRCPLRSKPQVGCATQGTFQIVTAPEGKPLEITTQRAPRRKRPPADEGP